MTTKTEPPTARKRRTHDEQLAALEDQTAKLKRKGAGLVAKRRMSEAAIALSDDDVPGAISALQQAIEGLTNALENERGE